MAALHYARVPHLAAWKRDCAWLRSMAHRVAVSGAADATHLRLDFETLTTDTLSLEHLQIMHTLVVEGKLDCDSAAVTSLAEEHGSSLTVARRRIPAGGAVLHPTLGNDATVSAQHMQLSASGVTAPALMATAAPANRMLALLGQVLAAAMHEGNKPLGQDGVIGVREQLLAQLLDWAKHDVSTLAVAEPRASQLRWRTQHEWEALRAECAQLGEHDTKERAGACVLWRCFVHRTQ